MLHMHSLPFCGNGFRPAEPRPLAPERPSPAAATSLPELPDDALGPRVAEFAEFERLSDAICRFGTEVVVAAEQLAAAPTALLSELGGMTLMSSSGKSLVPELASQLGVWSARLQAGASHLEAMRRLADSCREKAAVAREVICRRAEAHKPKAQADADAEALNHRFGHNFTLEEKRVRLQRRHLRNEEFKKLTEEAAAALDDALAQKGGSAAVMLAELCHYGAEVFGGAQPLAAEFGRLAKAFATARPSPPPAGGTCERADSSDGVRIRLRDQIGAALTGRPLPRAASAASPSGSGASASPGGPSLDGYSVGHRVQVWSEREHTWADGVVDRIFLENGVDEGYKVPAGVIKVSFARGTKYIRPENRAAELRRHPPA